MLAQGGLKIADLGHLQAAWHVHREWVERLEEEQFRQGDMEKQLRLPVSALMDRTRDGITKMQVCLTLHRHLWLEMGLLNLQCIPAHSPGHHASACKRPCKYAACKLVILSCKHAMANSVCRGSMARDVH